LNFLCKNTGVKPRVFIESALQGILSGMNLQMYFSEEPRGAKIEMARHLGISADWMSKLIAQKVKPSPVLARAIEDATGGLVTRKDLRPDLFG
jgi:DNA-binding transcriptional regulator YdaS (Cro superfamily)